MRIFTIRFFLAPLKQLAFKPPNLLEAEEVLHLWGPKDTSLRKRWTRDRKTRGDGEKIADSFEAERRAVLAEESWGVLNGIPLGCFVSVLGESLCLFYLFGFGVVGVLFLFKATWLFSCFVFGICVVFGCFDFFP